MNYVKWWNNGSNLSYFYFVISIYTVMVDLPTVYNWYWIKSRFLNILFDYRHDVEMTIILIQSLVFDVGIHQHLRLNSKISCFNETI